MTQTCQFVSVSISYNYWINGCILNCTSSVFGFPIGLLIYHISAHVKKIIRTSIGFVFLTVMSAEPRFD
jgi:hypothetical protein